MPRCHNKREIMGNMFGKNIPVEYTPEIYKLRDEAKTCNNCNCKLLEKHIDHDHLTGEFRQILCPLCNENLNFKGWELPVVIHNLKSYDSHFVIKALSYFKSINLKTHENNEIDIIPLSSEKYLSIRFDKLKFIDSFQFMASSLENLGKNLLISDKYIIIYQLQKI